MTSKRAVSHPAPADPVDARGPLPAGGRSTEAEIGDLLVRLLTSVKDHVFHGLAEMDLTPAQGFALHYLQEAMPMRRLAHEMGHDASYITGIVDQLEHRGLVERRADPSDRRVKLLVVTPEGRRLRQRVQDQVFDRQPVLDRLSVAQRTQLRDLLREAVGEGPER